jgi:hypothetical protein
MMAANAAKPMHQDFARWYGSVSMGDDTARRIARWQGILNLVGGAEGVEVEALLRLAHGGRAAPNAQAVQAVRQAFKEADDTFEMTGNDRELQVLAGVALVVLMEDLNKELGGNAALASTTAAVGGARKFDLPMNLAALGEAALKRRGVLIRKRPSLLKAVSIESPKFDFERAAAKVREQPDWQGVAAAFALAADDATVGMQALAQRQAKAIRAVDDFIRVQDEELQMLWWLTGQRSEDYDCAFDAVPADAQPFVFAGELAECTELLPGPPSVKSILSRAGLKERKKIAVTAAVNAPRADWLQKLVENIDPSPVSTPLHTAVKRQLETGPGEAWVAGWAASTGIDAAVVLPRLTLGELFYRERLLLLFR